MDGSPACPFVAFDDDRDARADRPDHRHRCFAEAEPAPRALAHQEAYCLSSAFPVCPTFQAWARREAAQARPGTAPAGATVAPAASDAPQDVAPPSRAAATESGAADEWAAAPPAPDIPIEQTPRRNPPRDWAAPPPWATGAGAGNVGGSSRSGGAGRPASDAPDLLGPRTEGQGLAGSAADRLASGASILGEVESPRAAASSAAASLSTAASRHADLPSAAPDPELAGLVGGGGAPRATPRLTDEERAAAGYPPSTRGGRRPAVSSTRSSRERDRERLPEHEHVQNHDGPSWERARRSEAYPVIKSRPGLSGFGGMPGLPRIAVLAGALAVAALALFFLPALLGVGGGDDPTATPSASIAPATPTPEPTPEPEPTPQTYVIQEGDTLSGIAREFGLTLDELLAANTETIENPDRISVGDEIIIPIPVPEEVDGGTGEETAAP